MSKNGEKWKVEVSIAGRKHRPGSFVSEIDAARAYDRVVITNNATVSTFGRILCLLLSNFSGVEYTHSLGTNKPYSQFFF